MTEVVVARGVAKAYREVGAGQGGLAVQVLKHADLTVAQGEVIAVVGASGSGKSTLLHCLGGLDSIDAGSVTIRGQDLAQLSDAERGRLRNEQLGFVYQFHHLLPEFSALENVVLPQLILGLNRAEAETRAKQLLGSLGLQERWDHRPAQLSGGEQQRVAIARAVANNPKVLLADEPTGNLDPPTAERVFEQLLALVRQSGVGAVIATHNLDLAARMDRTLRLTDGLLVEEEVVVATVAGG
jgi:lipoprotein-releasing system ATP-binding protein